MGSSMENDVVIPNGGQSFLMYDDENGGVKLRVLMQDETIWLSQKMMAELFDVTVPTINEHLKTIFAEEELSEDSVIRNFRITAVDGKSYNTKHYNLDAIISVGYRVNSKRATQFRKWATRVLTEYIRKGFVLDDERLKQGERVFQKDYFRELLERVRSIRASERRIYQQITDIFAECCIDYNAQSDITKRFYAMVQNKFLFAITGQTAPEIINERVDHSKPNVGLQTWKNAPNGRILQSDVLVSKNCLTEKEIRQLERTVSGYFDYIENLIERRQELTMQAMAESVNKFLTFNEYRILEGAGRISRDQATRKAIAEYQIFNRTQKIESDFDRSVKELGKQVKALKSSPKKDG